jgi:hypothetical protein
MVKHLTRKETKYYAELKHIKVKKTRKQGDVSVEKQEKMMRRMPLSDICVGRVD